MVFLDFVRYFLIFIGVLVASWSMARVCSVAYFQSKLDYQNQFVNGLNRKYAGDKTDGA
jgi:hypothetical protein